MIELYILLIIIKSIYRNRNRISISIIQFSVVFQKLG